MIRSSSITHVFEMTRDGHYRIPHSAERLKSIYLSASHNPQDLQVWRQLPCKKQCTSYSANNEQDGSCRIGLVKQSFGKNRKSSSIVVTMR